jgi:hypothetical protein
MDATTTHSRSIFGFRRGERTTDGPAMQRLRAIAGRQFADPAGEVMRAARRHTLEDAHLAWKRGDVAGATVLRSIADAIGQQLVARQRAY